jgi:hypothetical protein
MVCSGAWASKPREAVFLTYVRSGQSLSGTSNMMENAMMNTKLVTWALGIFAAVSFVFCVVFGFVTPGSHRMSEFLEMMLPAFKWLTWWGFLLGLVESFLYGAYVGLVYCPIHNWLHRRWGHQ